MTNSRSSEAQPNSTRAPTGRQERPVAQTTKKTTFRCKFRDGRAVRKSSLHGSVVKATKHTTSPTQPPPHCNSTALRVVVGVGEGFLWVISQVVGDVGMSVAQSVDVSHKFHRKGGNEKGSQRIFRDRVSKAQSTWPAESGETVKASGNFVKSPVDLACPVWLDGEGLRHPVAKETG